MKYILSITNIEVIIGMKTLMNFLETLGCKLTDYSYSAYNREATIVFEPKEDQTWRIEPKYE